MINGKNLKIIFIAGTRPEIIKLGILINKCKLEKDFKTIVIASGQHLELARPFWAIFDIIPDYNLQLMEVDQNHSLLSAKIFSGLTEIFLKESPDLVVVQGDTTSAAISALTAFHQRIPVAHVEAGLRTYDFANPYPEELNRRIIDLVAVYLFAPTLLAKENLLKENLSEKKIYVTGNTIIDALLFITKKDYPFKNKVLSKINLNKRVIILTTHRREAYLSGEMIDIFSAINSLLEKHSDIEIVYPIHPNPNVVKIGKKYLRSNPHLYLTGPLDYQDMVKLIKNSYLILTDSGGLQEEAPTFGKPVLVIRDKTERTEGISAGIAKLVGLKKENIIRETTLLLTNKKIYNEMSRIKNPYGDGKATERIVNIIKISG